jgi:N6-L-threonylcarbamoyladenine synthase
MIASGDLNFSFAGLKTAVLTLVSRNAPDDRARADIAAAFQKAAVDVLVAKSIQALSATGLDQLVVAGGVGANRQLRAALSDEATRAGFTVFYPPLELCTDNGAMMAFAGALRLQDARQRGTQSALQPFGARPRWDLEDLTAVSTA